MTVSTTLNKIIFQGNASQTAFPFTFAFPSGTATQEAANIQVFFTDTLGNVTQLVQGSSAANYQITFNAATGTNPTPVGGTVTYNPAGGPIPVGTSLTILRSLPLTQSTSLANQGTLYQPVEEAALDYLTMVSQQVLEVQSRALVVPVSDPAPAVMPAVSARKNLFLAFDASGNPIASQPSGANTPISSPMVPVVTAASLAAGRSAFGLGAVATLGIGNGLAASGGNLFAIPTPVIDSSSPITLASGAQASIRFATTAVTYNLPSTLTVSPGFYIEFFALGGAITFAINAGDAFSGAASGAGLSIPQGSQAYLITDGAGTWYISIVNGALSLNSALNLQLNASVASSTLTIALKDRNGNDPSTASPITVAFRDPAAANGDPVARAISNPLSITVPNGASLGTVNGQASRIWVGLFDNAGSPVLGVFNALSNAPSVFCWDETAPTSGTAISAGSTLPQVWYTASGVASRAFRILGYVESTQPTAGAWTATPSKIQLFGPGVKKPGDIVQTTFATFTQQTTASATFVVLQSLTLTSSSSANLMKIESYGPLSCSTSATEVLQISRGAVANTSLIGSTATLGLGSSSTINAALQALDAPNTAGSLTYSVQGKTTAGTLGYGNLGILEVTEIFA